jgi:Domain of unknown function (DUF6438)
MKLASLVGICWFAVATDACVGSSDLPVPSAATRGDLEGVTEREISLTRSSCFGTCPVYTVVYHRDGTVKYTGEQHVDYIGERLGRISVADFAELARFVKQSGFEGLDDRYRTRGTDMPTTTVTVAHIDGNSKAVAEYRPSGPPRLWAIQRVIDGLLAQVQWQNKNAG